MTGGRNAHLTAGFLTGVQGLRATIGTTCPTAQQTHQPVIGHDQTDQQIPPDQEHLAPVKRGNKQHDRDERAQRKQAEEFEAQRQRQRDHIQQRRRHGITEQTAHAKFMCPVFTGRQGRRKNRGQRDGNRGENRAAQDTVGPLVQRKSRAPAKKRKAQRPCAKAHNHMQGRRDRRAKPPKQVRRRCIRRGHPTGIFGHV